MSFVAVDPERPAIGLYVDSEDGEVAAALLGGLRRDCERHLQALPQDSRKFPRPRRQSKVYDVDIELLGEGRDHHGGRVGREVTKAEGG